ncbi:hypothetical protein DUNSADRAFT_3043 [Dunaliella salina]|uniref:Encoded protein n=1 Tax=Dunaliella salina TaxID=3046 RepID=A0ABQ7GUM8_DUNSA|nr:hypothetical protein DUNSADRAFT_3043 [Dunaliella salina]|eukprot:KAF5838311.1 hypothetical protein DUNSADRAFT_3043 [Dunaliella salina]
MQVMKELDRKMQEKVDMLGKALLRTAQQVDTLHNEMREQTMDRQPGTSEAAFCPSLAAIQNLGRLDCIKSLLTSNRQMKGEESALDRAMWVMGRQGEDRSKKEGYPGSTTGGLSALQYIQQTSSYGRCPQGERKRQSIMSRGGRGSACARRQPPHIFGKVK